MTDEDFARDIRELERNLSAVKSDVIAATNEAGNAKHEVRQVAQQNVGITGRLDKLEAHVSERIESLSQKIDDKFERIEARLTAKIDSSDRNVAGIRLQQQKGLSFFSGIAFVVVGCGGLLIAFWKLLSGGSGG